MQDKSVQVIRHQPLSIERAFDAWIDPHRIRQWLVAPSPLDAVIRVETDPVPGGWFSFVVLRDGEDIEHLGEYLEVLRPHRLAFTWQVPKYSPDVTTVQLDFVATSAWKCELTLTHTGVPQEYAERTAAGWTRIIDAAGQAAD